MGKEQGVAPADIRLPTGLPELREATPLWIMNAVKSLNSPLSTDKMTDSIGCTRIGRIVGFSNEIFLTNASNLRKQLLSISRCLSEFRTKIERSQPLWIDMIPGLAEDIQEDYEGNDDKHVPLSLSSAQVCEERYGIFNVCLEVFRLMDGGIPYDEEWDEEAFSF